MSILDDAGLLVLESLYPNGFHNIIWIRVYPISHDEAHSWACVVANDYVKHFHSIVTVHFYGPSGLDDELATCTDQP